MVDVHDDVANVHTAVSEVQRDTKETYNLVSDIHNNLLKRKEKSDDRQQLAVSDARTSAIIEWILTLT